VTKPNLADIGRNTYSLYIFYYRCKIITYSWSAWLAKTVSRHCQ